MSNENKHLQRAQNIHRTHEVSFVDVEFSGEQE